jgi:putative transcriptional regulator
MNDLEKIINFKPTGIKAEKGTFLLSEPLIPDSIFKRSVLLLAEFDNEGAFGLIVNKPSHQNVNELTDEFEDCNLPVFIGGPVHIEQLFFLHTLGYIADSYEIIDGIFWGGNLEEVKIRIKNGEINNSNFKFFIGYSGWIKNQLESEIKRQSWLITPAKIKDVFSENPEGLWVDMIKRFGDKYQNWINIPTNPQFN